MRYVQIYIYSHIYIYIIIFFVFQLWTGCTSLSSINVSYCTKLSDPISSDCLQSIPVSLRKLSLCGVGIRDAELLANALGRLPMLESLKLSGVPALCDDTIEIVSDIRQCSMFLCLICRVTNISIF